MKSTIIYSLLICGLLSMINSCTKKELDDKKYFYGSLAVEYKNLPGSPLVDLYIDNEKRVFMGPGTAFTGASALPVDAEKTVLVQLKKKDTDSLILDTTLTVPKDKINGIQFAWSEVLDMKGFIQPRQIGQDSISFQVFNNLNEQLYPYPDIDLIIQKMDILNNFEIKDTVVIVPNFKKGQLMPQVITVPTGLDESGNPALYYVGRMVNRQTGEYIVDAGSGVDYFLLILDPAFYKGTFSICPVENDLFGYISVNPITL